MRLLQTSSRRSGAGSARNIGIAASSADVLCFADADDIYYKEHFFACLSALHANPTVAFVKTHVHINTSHRILPEWHDVISATLVQSMCVRRVPLSFIEGFPPIELEDVWVTRLLGEYFKGAILPPPATMEYAVKHGGRAYEQLQKFQAPIDREHEFTRYIFYLLHTYSTYSS